MAFHVGQKVVCVNGIYLHPNWYRVKNRPVERAIYTIREIARGWFECGADGIRLEEMVNDAIRWYGGEVSEPAFWSGRFRPMIDRKSEVSFTIGADPKSEKWDNRRRVTVRS